MAVKCQDMLGTNFSHLLPDLLKVALKRGQLVVDMLFQ